MKKVKKLIGLILSVSMIFGLSVTAFASESSSTPEPPKNSDGVYEITEEYIEKYGVHTKDEYGNDIIEVPLGPAADITEPLSSEDECTEGVHEGHSIPDGVVQTRHFILTDHTHEVVNLTSANYSGFVGVTQYAMAGFTITKEYNESFQVNATLSLSGGITKSAVETALGVSVGGSYTRGSGESYSATVPSGYRGRIAYRYYSTLYMFDNKTTYFWSYTPLVTSEEYNACSAETAPYDGYYYLQLLAV